MQSETLHLPLAHNNLTVLYFTFTSLSDIELMFGREHRTARGGNITEYQI